MVFCMWLLPQPLNSPTDRQLMALSDNFQHHWTISEKCLKNGIALVQFMDLVLKWPKRRKLVLIYQKVSEALGAEALGALQVTVERLGQDWRDDSRVQTEQDWG